MKLCVIRSDNEILMGEDFVAAATGEPISNGSFLVGERPYTYRSRLPWEQSQKVIRKLVKTETGKDVVFTS